MGKNIVPESEPVSDSGSDPQAIIELKGRVADLDVKRLQTKLEQLYKKRFQQIVVDVSQTDFLDSHGLGTIVYYHTLLQKENRTLLVLNANPDTSTYINKLFELTNLDKVLHLVRSL